MADAYPNLGVKLIEAARLAVAMHLYQGHGGNETGRQQVVIGGAGPAFFTDEELPIAPDRLVRSSRLAEGGAE